MPAAACPKRRPDTEVLGVNDRSHGLALRVNNVVHLNFVLIEVARRCRAVASDAVQKAFRTGFLVGITIQRICYFLAHYFHSSSHTNAPLLGQVAVLGTTWCVVAFGVMSVYAAVGEKLATRVDSLNAQRIFNRITGGIFIAAGGALAWVKRADS